MPRGTTSPTTREPSPRDWSPTVPRQQNWPLPAATPASPSSAYSTSARGPPPRRPPRPNPSNISSQVPQFASGTRPASSNSMSNGAGVWNQDGYSTPSPRPPTSTTSASLYSIPPNPPSTGAMFMPQPPPVPQTRQPQMPLPSTSPRVRAPLGPPPSARRGPSSYYMQHPSQLLVTPIVEESDSQKNSERGSFLRPDEFRGSYASSNAIPIGIPNYYLNKNARYTQRTMDSYNSNYDDNAMPPAPQFVELSRQDSPPILIRKASLGKKTRPTLTTIKGAEPSRPAFTGASAAGVSDPSLVRTDSSESKGDASRRTGSSGALDMGNSQYLDRSPSESDDDDYMGAKSKDDFGESLPSSPEENDPRILSIINRLEKGGAIPHASDKTSHLEQPTALSGRARPKNGLKIDVDAVRDAESRGSLTSLPDLIARATQLASNLDRGKTASRLGMDWAFRSHSEERIKNIATDEKTRSRPGSFGRSLSLYPPFNPDRRQSKASGRFRWPENLRRDESQQREGEKRASGRSRRYVCGMPIWAFFSLLLLLILLIAAAVIVPVVLIVIPHQNQQSVTTLASCQQQLQCKNAAINVVGTDNTCRCLCVNGFTGNTCTVADEAECSSINAVGANNATAGDAIPRLIDDSERNYSIPLDARQVLSLFSMTNLSCDTQNGLISFDQSGTSRRRDLLSNLFPHYKRNPGPLLTPTPTSNFYLLDARQNPGPAASSASSAAAIATTLSAQPVATSAGIVFASGGAPGAEATTAPQAVSADQRDFARTAVLFVLQDSGQLNWAISARTAFDSFFQGKAPPGASSNNITLGNNYSADINSFRVVSRNGTVVGK